jgi:hypothetical protein
MPTATDRDFLDMPVSDIRRITHSGRDHHVVLLQEPQAVDACRSSSAARPPPRSPYASWATPPNLSDRLAPT